MTVAAVVVFIIIIIIVNIIGYNSRVSVTVTFIKLVVVGAQDRTDSGRTCPGWDVSRIRLSV